MKEILLTGRGLSKTFGSRRGGDQKKPKAVDSVDVSIRSGEFVAVVGESGSGKSTLARMLLGLISPDEGSVCIDGTDLTSKSRREQFEFRGLVQAVLQDPAGSLNPRKTVRKALSEIVVLYNIASGKDAIEAHAVETLERVGLSPAQRYLDRFPHELSGGQRQRILIARALIPRPRIIVADEAVSALDVAVKTGILELMTDLQRDLGIGYVFITHDLTVVQKVADYVYVMQSGRVVEEAKVAELFANPQHSCTRSLIEARLEVGPVLRERFPESRGLVGSK
jgi:ABC-type oligopeptide transport system ATPase subunit